jgi:hypothetical protein
LTRVVKFNLNSQIDKQFLISVLFPILDSHYKETNCKYFVRDVQSGVKPKSIVIIDEAEYENAESAIEEWAQTGRTERRCLRCGGQFRFDEGSSYYRITCENGDF